MNYSTDILLVLLSLVLCYILSSVVFVFASHLYSQSVLTFEQENWGGGGGGIHTEQHLQDLK